MNTTETTRSTSKTSAVSKESARAGRNGSGSTRKTSENLESNVLLKTLIAFKRGNFSARMPVDQTGLAGKIADALNDILELNQKMVSELRGSAGRWARKARSPSAPPSDR